MSPELAARVEASVRGRRAAPGARLTPRSTSWLRAAILVSLLSAGLGVAVLRQRAARAFEAERDALLERSRREAARVSPAQRAVVDEVGAWLRRGAAPFDADWIEPELRSAEALDRALRRPMVYVRGEVASFRDDAGIARSAAASFADALVVCLLDPPRSRTEKALSSRARGAVRGSDPAQSRMAHVERLNDAIVGLPFSTDAWRARVQSSEHLHELQKLRRAFDRAPLEAARRVARAEVLLFAMDEPGRGIAELDGERPHPVRVGLVDLRARKMLLSLRRDVDPSWISAGTRAEYAAGIDSCALALDVRSAVTTFPGG